MIDGIAWELPRNCGACCPLRRLTQRKGGLSFGCGGRALHRAIGLQHDGDHDIVAHIVVGAVARCEPTLPIRWSCGAQLVLLVSMGTGRTGPATTHGYRHPRKTHTTHEALHVARKGRQHRLPPLRSSDCSGWTSKVAIWAGSSRFDALVCLQRPSSMCTVPCDMGSRHALFLTACMW